jgi:hypothetical protein
MHPTFMRGNLIVSEIEVQAARDPELNPGNHMAVRSAWFLYEGIFSIKTLYDVHSRQVKNYVHYY